MATHVHFLNEKSLIVKEDFGSVNRSLVDNGAALVHRQSGESHIAVFASTITYIEEYQGGQSAPLVA